MRTILSHKEIIFVQFPLDLGPTLLEMAGAGSRFLFGKEERKEATYGSEMWNFIKNSIDPSKHRRTWQKPRKVSYSSTLYFNITEETTTKNLYTGLQPVLTPRHWDAVWPKDGDLLM